MSHFVFRLDENTKLHLGGGIGEGVSPIILESGVHGKLVSALGVKSDDAGSSKAALSEAQLASRIVEEIECDVGWDRVGRVDPQLQYVVLLIQDAASRRHELKVNIRDYSCSSDSLPWPLPKASSLKSALEAFEHVIGICQNVWDSLDEIDAKFFVVDPPLPAPRSVLKRRIAIWDDSEQIQTTVFLEVRFTIPHLKPLFNMIGPPALIQPWSEKIAASAVEQRTMLQTLRKYNWLASKPELEFKDRNENVIGECGICYVFRLEISSDLFELPDDQCESCSKRYHKSCLRGWLQTLPSSRSMFGVLVGECPYCNKSISARTD